MRLSRKPSKRLLLALLCLTSIVLMVLGQRARWLCRLTRPVLMPLSNVGMAVTAHVRGRTGQVWNSSEQDNDARLAELRQDLLKKQEIINQLNRKLTELRGWDSVLRRARPNQRPLTAYSCKLIDAIVVGGEGLPLRQRMLVGVGNRQGVASGDLVTTRLLLHEFPRALPLGLSVLGRNYVVGRIIDSSAHSATLQLVTDRSFRLPARILRLVDPGEKRTAYVSGSGGALVRRVFRHDGSSSAAQVAGEPIAVRADGDGGQIVCRQVSAHHEIRPGDELTTGGTEALPFALTIGRVSRTEPEKADPHFVTVHVKPLADLAGLREVYIVLPVATRDNN